jgi:uncharacterized repeat protein (TIGR01451 family)
VGAFEVQAAPVTQKSDLKITEKDSPDPVALGGTLTYTLTGTNQGPTTDTSVKITDQLPSSVTYLSSDPSQGTCTHSGQTVTCQIGTLAGTGASAPAAKRSTSASRTATVRIRVRPRKTGTLTNVVKISGALSETTTANNRATVHTTVIERHRPRISLSGVPSGCVTGAFSFRVRIRDESSLRGVRGSLDGRTAFVTKSKSFRVSVNGSRLHSGRHVITIVAVDRYGNRARSTGSFRRCRRAVLPRFTG